MIEKIKGKFIQYTGWSDKLLLILIIFTCTYFVYRDFGVRMIFGYAFLGFYLLVHLIRRIMLKKRVDISRQKLVFLFLVLVILISFLRPDSLHDYDNATYVIAMVLCTIFLVFWDSNKEEALAASKVLLTAALLLALFVIFFTVFPDLFWNSIFNHMTPVAQEYLLYYVPKGYGITLGGVTYTDYILYYGYVVSVANIMISKKFDKKRIINLVFAAVLFISVFLSGRRSELLALVGTTVILFVLSGKTKAKIMKRLFCILGALAAAVVLLILILPHLKEIDSFYRYAITVENLLNGYDISSGRFELYAMAFSAFLQNPILGIGWRKFSLLIPESFHLAHGADVKDVHSIYLQFLCETGILGTICITAVLAFFLYHTVKMYRLTYMGERKIPYYLTTISLLVQVFMLMIGFIDPCFTKLVFWNFYSIAIMFLYASAKMEEYCFIPDDNRIVVFFKNKFKKKIR